jgi:hypothetical protein
VGGFFGCGVVEVAAEGFGVLGFGFGVGEDFVVEAVLIGLACFECEGVLGGVEVVEFCLGFVAEEAGELGQGYGLF